VAANEIVIKVKLDDNGSFKLVEKEAKKAAKATDDLGKSRNRYNKGEKGVIGATSNGTKAFSKMRDSMTGSTGLVSAYAVLASNVFAATAAFNAFRRAAQVQQLEAGLVAVGAAAGTNLGYVSDGLRRITGEALSAEQAMRATALASASGFRSDQLNNLAKVAKGASLALGRDMGDAFDRLVRGTAKVEPEILDELGIFVRLDDAVRDYARELGVAEGSLTQYERSQAFLNATIEQGLEKYQDLSEQIDPNPYDKLSAALADLQKNALGFVNNFLRLGDVVGFASRNLGSLAAVATTLGGAVTGTVAPGLLRIAESSAESAEQLFQNRKAMAQTLTGAKNLPPVFTSLVEKIDNGTATTKEFSSAHASLLGQLGANERRLKAFTQAASAAGPITAEAAEQIEIMSNTSSVMRQRMEDLKDIQREQANASIAASRANGVANATSLNLVAAFKDLGQAHREDKEETRKGTEQKKGFSKVLSGLGPAARTGAAGLKVLGAAFFTILPYIGIIISAVSVLYGVIKEKFFPEDVVKKRIDEAVSSFESFTKTAESFNQSAATGGTRLVNSYIAYAGVLDQLIGRLREMRNLTAEQAAEGLRQSRIDAANARAKIATLEEQRRLLQEGGAVPDTQEFKTIDTGITDVNRFRPMTREEAIASIQGQIDGQQALVDATIKAEGQIQETRMRSNAEAVKAILQGYETQFDVAKELARKDETSPFSLAKAEADLARIVALRDQYVKTDEAGNIIPISDEDYSELIRQLELLAREPNAVVNAFKQLPEAMSKVKGAINDVAKGVRTPFQDVRESLTGVQKLARDVANLDPGDDPQKAKELEGLVKQLEQDLKGLPIPKEIAEAFGNGTEAVDEFLRRVIEIETSMATLNQEAKKLEATSKAIGDATKGIAGSETLSLTAANDARNKKIELLNKEIEGLMLISDTDEKHAQAVESIAKKRAEIGKLDKQNLSTKEIELLAEQSLLKLTQERNKLAAIRVANDLKAMKIAAIAEKGFINAADEAKFKNTAAQNAIKAAKLEYDLLEAQFKVRVKLLDAQLRANGVELETRQEILALLDAELVLQRQIADEKIRGAALDAGAGLVGSGAGVGGGTRGSPLARIAGTVDGELGGVLGSTAGIYDQFAASAANMASARKNESTATSDVNNALSDSAAVAMGMGPDGMTQEQADEQLAAAKTRLQEAKATSQAVLQEINATSVSMLTGLLETQAKAMASLGPEGEVAAAFTMFSANMLTSFEAFSETAEGSADRIAAGFQMAAAAISGVASIMNAKNQAAISAIDDQIAAEKKRDGKSAQSLQRIAALEKKKEAAKKKAFEQNKKMQMAQVIISTAAGIASAYAAAASAAAAAGPAAPAVFATLSSMMIGIIAATGALQLGLIAGTSYQGGGGAPSAGAGPTSISMGQRKTTTDLARSQSARGELAYFRGESGTGGPENFRNAFSGYRNRAGGGNTAFMVGEQGPEMFVPETPGTIVPNDDVAQAAPTNVNFSISAVDAAGVEDLLIRQQGNIIGMIREAANSYGQDFVETVDTSVFNDTTSGVSRY